MRDYYNMSFCRQDKIPVNDYGQSPFKMVIDRLSPSNELYCFTLGSSAHRELRERFLID